MASCRSRIGGTGDRACAIRTKREPRVNQRPAVNRYPSETVHKFSFRFVSAFSAIIFLMSRSPRVLVARHRLSRTGCGVLRARLVTALPGGVRKPALRHYERTQ